MEAKFLQGDNKDMNHGSREGVKGNFSPEIPPGGPGT